MPKKILLMHISKRSGHYAASLAIEHALKIIDPQVEILSINAFNYTNPVLEKVINKTYMGVVRTKPEVWDYLYDNPKILRSTKRLRELIHRFNSRRLKDLIDEFSPDAVACTQAFPAGMVADFKKTYNRNFPLFGILTDFAPHSYWVYDNIDGYIVPSLETGKRLIDNGIKRSRVNAFGIPIDPRFEEAPDRESVHRKLGLDPDVPTVLIMGGWQGLGPIRHLVAGLDKSIDIPLQMVVIAGINKSLYRYLKKRDCLRRKKVLSLSYTDNVDELMHIASLIITKPGGVTTAEALARNLPILILHPLPGQESMNTESLLKMDVALKANDYKEAIVLTEALLTHPTKLEQMRERAKRHGKPDSATMTAELILKSIK